MNKRVIYSIVFFSIFLIVFNLCFFLFAGIDKTVATWFSYSFIHLSYVFLIIIFISNNKNDRDKLWGLSLDTISIIYFIVELILGIIIIFLNTPNWKASSFIQIIVLAVYGVIMIPLLLVSEK